MKVNELMVGDWVNMGNPVTDELVPTKIENIYGEEINCKTDHTSDDVPTIIYGEWLRYAQPIPLTEEILVKNGFSYEEDTFLPDTGYWSLSDEDGLLYLTINAFGVKGSGEVAFGYQDIALNYVHQLQHLLRLCGIDKEISI